MFMFDSHKQTSPHPNMYKFLAFHKVTKLPIITLTQTTTCAPHRLSIAPSTPKYYVQATPFSSSHVQATPFNWYIVVQKIKQ